MSIIQAIQGRVSPAVILTGFLKQGQAESPHFETTDLDMLTLRPGGPLNVEQLSQTLASGDLGIIRAKGFATSLNGERQLVQVVGKRWEITPAANDLEEGIVCLGFKKMLNRAALAELGEI